MARPTNALLLTVAGLLASPAATSAEPAVLAPVVVTAPRWEAPWLDTPAALTAIDAAEVQTGAQNLALDEPLNRLPGIYAQNRYNPAQGERLSIRGFGARANFGIRGVRVLVDDIPLTLPDGQTALEGLDLSLADRIEVIRGPASALYGNAAGGVVRVETREPERDEFRLGLSTGSDGFREIRLDGGLARGDWSGLGAVSLQRLDGHRDHSEARENGFYGKLSRALSGGGQIIGIVSLVETEFQDPGALTAAEMANDRTQAASRNLGFAADEETTQGRLGLVWHQPLGANRELRLRLFGGWRDFANRLPFESGGQVELERRFAGAGVQYLHATEQWRRPLRVSVGADLELQRDDRRNYDNLAGRRGALALDQDEKVDAIGVFGQAEWQAADRWAFTLGARWDRNRIEVDDRFLSDGNDSGRRSLSDASYQAGAVYALDDRQRLYANVGTAFETPTTTELANPAGGGFSPDLESQRARNVELGLKGEWPRLRYEASVFRTEVKDELISYQLGDETGRDYFRNAGRSRRQGLELAADWRFAPDWRIGAAYTEADYRFRDYVVDGVNLKGKRLPGIPRRQLFTELAYDTERYYGAVNLLGTDDLYADDANHERVDGYWLANLRLGLRRNLGQLRAELYAGINNLLDEDYAANIRINAAGGRYYEPAPGRSYYAGLKLGY